MKIKNRFFLDEPFQTGIVPGPVSPDRDLIFFFLDNRLLILGDNKNPRIPTREDFSELPAWSGKLRYFGSYRENNCSVAVLSQAPEFPFPTDLVELRQLFGFLCSEHLALAGRALQIIHWEQAHRFCGHCGSRNEDKKNELSRICPACGLMSYPRIAPVVIVLIERDKEVLLARSPRFPPGLYSALAGYVEPGETLEEAIKREVREEVDLEIKDLRYFSSQPWPCSDALMIGFTAQYCSGQIQVDGVEIEEAHWFKPEMLPDIPSRLTIARALLDDYLVRNG